MIIKFEFLMEDFVMKFVLWVKMMVIYVCLRVCVCVRGGVGGVGVTGVG